MRTSILLLVACFGLGCEPAPPIVDAPVTRPASPLPPPAASPNVDANSAPTELTAEQKAKDATRVPAALAILEAYSDGRSDPGSRRWPR